MENKNINFEWDDSSLKANLKKIATETDYDMDEIITKCAQDFVGSATTWTPPSIGKRAIEKKYWSRPILALGKLVRNQYEGIRPTALDYKMFHQKFNYKVLNTKVGAKKGDFIGYYKTKAQAKMAARIETRGLARVMWRKKFTFYWWCYSNKYFQYI